MFAHLSVSNLSVYPTVYLSIPTHMVRKVLCVCVRKSGKYLAIYTQG